MNTSELKNIDGIQDFSEAAALQQRWAKRVREEPLKKNIRWVPGADVAFPKGKEICLAGVVLLRFPELEPVEYVHATRPLTVPYVPGFLSFREAPAVFAAFEKLSRRPDIMLIDGQGRAHPRRFGLACHIGLGLDLPTVGCGKSRLVGTHREVGPEKGDRVALMDGKERIGTVLRTRNNMRCLYLSVGHRADLAGAADFVLQCCGRFRLPEPTRLADKYVSRLRSDGRWT